jgi:hypothetical protein
MIYEILFWIGLIGLSAQALLGLGGHGHAQSQGRSGHAATAAHGHSSHVTGRTGDFLLSLLSPLAAFSVCLGIGAGGLLLRAMPLLSPARIALAVLSGVVFYGLLVRPMQKFIFQFASKPAKGLDGSVAQTAEALSHFDAGGKGLVRLTVDDQLVRILAYLDSDDQPEAAAVQPGDQLTVISIDGHTNSCRVARL